MSPLSFSTPAAAPEIFVPWPRLEFNCVAGTTGWFADLKPVSQSIGEGGTALVWSANFSVGVNLFLDAVAHTAALSRRSQITPRGAGKFITHKKKMRLPARCKNSLKKCERQVMRVPSTSAPAVPGRIRAHTKSASIPSRHHHFAAHGAQPRRFCARRFAGSSLDRWQEGCLRISRNSRSVVAAMKRG